ncbi:vWA domain-containing protein [Candidatus Chloroploca asiatica]|uniref:VWFA domain-containing protein n=1 Tax=Candidatus Chloroploca asiatica TaxID=1506545 RepID=A0A2H3L2V1_9CHLR|nr:VWA domain-containing protein [Candidatus Chloroploca asiatica]PDV97458.1 hypothetical protein A9Q02_22485 [Candidatus Chloroploca asiatica]
MTEFNFADSSTGRRLPIYLLLDTSSSMGGAPIQAVNQGVVLLYNELMNTPQAVETCWISVITFDSTAQQVVALTELTQFTPPPIQANGATSMGAALDLLGQSLDREVTGNTGERKGDYKPLIFLLTDGEPTDDWRSALSRLRSRTQKKPATIIALGCGVGANMSTLDQIADVRLRMVDATPDNIAAFFKWVSQSVKVASVSAAGGGGQMDMPAPPPQLTISI